MALKTYNGVSYDPKVDYAAQLKGITDPNSIDALNKQRAAKIYGEGLTDYVNTLPEQYRMGQSGTPSIPLKTYNGVSYDPKVDYAAQLKGVTDQNTIDAINKQRAAKIYGEGLTDYVNTLPEQYRQGGAVGTPFNNPVNEIMKIPKLINDLDPNNLISQISGIMNTGAYKPPEYKSPYGDQIAQTLSSVQGMIKNPQQYDPSGDAGLQQAQKMAMDTVMKAGVRRNMVFADSTKRGMMESAAGLIPQFQQAFNANQQNQISNLGNLLGMMQGVDSSEYGRYRDSVSDASTAQQNQIANLMNLFGLAKGQDDTQYARGRDTEADNRYYDERDYGRAYTEQRDFTTDTGNRFANQEQYNAFTNPTTAQLAKIQEISKMPDIQAYMNKLNPNTAEYTLAQIARAQKIGANPQLANQYGQQAIGQQTLAGQQAQQQQQLGGQQSQLNQQQILQNQLMLAQLPMKLQQELDSNQAQIVGQQMSNAINSINLQYLPKEKQMGLKQAQLQLESGNLANAAQIIQNQYLPESLQSEIANRWANAASTTYDYTTYKPGSLAMEGERLDISKENAANKANESDFKYVETKAKTFRDYIKSNLMTSSKYDKNGKIVTTKSADTAKVTKYLEGIINSGDEDAGLAALRVAEEYGINLKKK